MPLGVTLTLYIGPQNVKPAPRELMEALQSVEVSHNDSGRSGFQLVFQTGRSNRDRKDYQLMGNPLLQPFNRVIVVMTINATAEVLMDGIITNQQFAPSQDLGGSTLTLTGEDVSIMMDLEERSVEHTNQSDVIIVNQILARYQRYGLIPKVITPPFNDQPSQNDRIPTQQGTDLSYIQQLAGVHSFIFYVTAGPALRSNLAYWGPPKRNPPPQKALSVNQGGYSNVNSISVQYNALAATQLKGQFQDRRTNEKREISITRSTRRPALAAKPALSSQTQLRIQQFRDSGESFEKAQSIAQSRVDQAVDGAVTITGELDTARYGAILRLRGLVGLRGVGQTQDGLYYVKSVTHKIQKGDYKQNFTLTREGSGSRVQRVDI
ncbi:phage late control D family protein [Alkalinema pantanalense CENA528]|uniref:phage late control D family protein n=1 Tax=Alkalinema pantanalense TaxID=1620705 RepID=UPI003D6DB69C